MTVPIKLSDRMRLHEEAARAVLPRRLPVIVRVDGKAFSRLTAKLERPFDPAFVGAMDEVARTLCEEIQGAQLAYVQSDEISVLVHGYKTFSSQPWFDNAVQKIVSVAAAIAASTFTFNSPTVFGSPRQAAFDARCFVLPEVEVANYFLWRQQDATRNSVQMLARCHFSQRELEGVANPDALGMLRAKGVSWEDMPFGWQRGRAVVKRARPASDGSIRHVWQVEDAPLFAEDRAYVERLLATEEG